MRVAGVLELVAEDGRGDVVEEVADGEEAVEVVLVLLEYADVLVS